MKRILVAAVAALGLGISFPAFAAVGVNAEGGVQGFTSDLGSALRPGPNWGASADLQPNAPLGLELRYEGASNQLFGSGNVFSGPREARVVQNGGEALAKLSLAHNNKAIFEPFVGAGVGFSHFNLSNPVAGFNNDTVGEVPFAAGIALHPGGHFNIGLRGDYDVLFSNDFAPEQYQTGQTFRGQLTLGGNF